MPRRKAGHGSLELDEFDPDAVIRRAPELALVDELAHTNAPGSRNAKRYEDIDEVLEAGIDVISTVNVQHLESLNDAVFQLTGVRVREAFPDRILDDADEVILVDLSPEALQQRLRAGKVYPLERTEAALQNFFRADNLAALRELALREVVEDVGARRHTNVLDPLSRQAVSERILALVKPEPAAQRLLRRAWRSAQRLGADVDALWVRRPGRGTAPRSRRCSSRPCGDSRSSSARTSSKRRATTSSKRCDASSSTAARPTSCSAPPTRAAGVRSREDRSSREWCASSPAWTSASSPTVRCDTELEE